MALKDLLDLPNMECVAAVPVGITKHREGLVKLASYNKDTANQVLDVIDEYAQKSVQKYGNRRIYCSDEFYLLAERKIPDARFYGDFLLLENGVGLWSLLRSEVQDALSSITPADCNRHISIATGVDAYSLIRGIADLCEQIYSGLKCDVYAIKNNFFGEKITVSGLVTATDIYEQLNGKALGSKLLIPSVMLRQEGDMFLDSITAEELSEKLGVNIEPVDNDGYTLVDTILSD